MHKLVMVVVALAPAVALAQQTKAAEKPATPPAPAAAAPKAPPEVKQTVDAFKGNWKFETTMTATGIPGMDKPVTGKMTFNCKEVAGKTAVACDAKTKTPMGPYEGLFVISYDPYSKAVHFVSFTNMHEVHDHSCKWASPTSLTCTPLKAGSGPAGDEVTEEVSMTWESPKKVSFKSVSKMTKGGGTMTLEGTGKK